MVCYELKLNSIKEIEEYFENEKELYDMAKLICKHIGVRYDSLTAVVDNYVSNWVSLGYDKETLVTLSNYCFLRAIRSLDGLNTLILKFYKLGLIDIEEINTYISELNDVDAKIKKILTSLGLERSVIQQDRNFYNTWVTDWNINDELIEYACNLGIENAFIQEGETQEESFIPDFNKNGV